MGSWMPSRHGLAEPAGSVSVAELLGEGPDLDEIEGLVDERTRILLVNTPHNPTGTILPLDRYHALIELCRKHGISDATYYNWKSKYGGMEASDLKRMKELEGELSQYKRMYAELARENDAMRNLIAKKL